MFRQFIEKTDAKPSRGTAKFIGIVFICLFCGLFLMAVLDPDGNSGVAAVVMFPLAIIGMSMLLKPESKQNLISPWLLVGIGVMFICLGVAGGAYRGSAFLGIGVLGVWPIMLGRKRLAKKDGISKGYN